jgi:hypothetical protein
LFCDDALGSNIGVINEKAPALWEKWDVSDRFWQDRIWCTDINSFAWSPDLRYLYVATSSIYGNGGFYKLDLIHRKATRLIPSEITPYFTETKHAYETEIKSIGSESGQVEVTFDFFNATKNSREKRNIIIK